MPVEASSYLLASRVPFSVEETELYELTELAGVTVDPKVFKWVSSCLGLYYISITQFNFTWHFRSIPPSSLVQIETTGQGRGTVVTCQVTYRHRSDLQSVQFLPTCNSYIVVTCYISLVTWPVSNHRLLYNLYITWLASSMCFELEVLMIMPSKPYNQSHFKQIPGGRGWSDSDCQFWNMLATLWLLVPFRFQDNSELTETKCPAKSHCWHVEENVPWVSEGSENARNLQTDVIWLLVDCSILT